MSTVKPLPPLGLIEYYLEEYLTPRIGGVVAHQLHGVVEGEDLEKIQKTILDSYEFALTYAVMPAIQRAFQEAGYLESDHPWI